MSEDEDLAAVKAVVAQLNRGWQEQDFASLEPLFHANAVIIGAQGAVLAQGRAACVKAYADYADTAVTLAFDMGEPVVLVHGATAVVRLHFHIRYRLAGADQAEHGGEDLVLVQENGRWQILWRGILPGKGNSPGL
ncbi:MAG: YybH family protein [Rhodothalassiaceae bacterium]